LKGSYGLLEQGFIQYPAYRFGSCRRVHVGHFLGWRTMGCRFSLLPQELVIADSNPTPIAVTGKHFAIRLTSSELTKSG
jgi:hypothetical protein